MPYLVKKISANLLDYHEGVVEFVSMINSEIGVEGYSKVNSFIAFTQDFSSVTKVENGSKLIKFGPKNKENFKVVEISY